MDPTEATSTTAAIAAEDAISDRLFRCYLINWTNIVSYYVRGAQYRLKTEELLRTKRLLGRKISSLKKGGKESDKIGIQIQISDMAIPPSHHSILLL